MTGAYQGEAFARTKRLKPLKAYLSKTKNAKPNMANIVAALGVSMDEIEKVRGEAGV